MSHLLTVHVYWMCIRFTGFQARIIFFLCKKYVEFKTVANLIRLHSYGRRVSRMTDELVNVSRMAEWVRERPFDFNERAGRRGEKMPSGLELFLLWRDLVFLFASYTKCIITFTPVLDIFSWHNRILVFFFFSKNLHAHPNKNQMVALLKKTEKVSDW